MEPAAVIDIGTNSVKLLVAGRAKGIPETIIHKVRVTRLGKGLAPGQSLDPGAAGLTLDTVAGFVDEARQKQAAPIILLGTEAIRRAADGAGFLQRVEEKTSLAVRVLSGEEEARLGLVGVDADFDVGGRRLLLVDVGGGSIELTARRESQVSRTSIPLGCVALLESCLTSDPPTRAEWRKLRDNVTARLQPGLAMVESLWGASPISWIKGPSLYHPAWLVEESHPVHVRTRHGSHREVELCDPVIIGVGGTVVTMGMLCRAEPLEDFSHVHGQVVYLAQLEDLIERLGRLPLEGRRRVQGMPEGRADVILPGLGILQILLRHLSQPQLVVSVINLMQGAMLDAWDSGSI